MQFRLETHTNIQYTILYLTSNRMKTQNDLQMVSQ